MPLEEIRSVAAFDGGHFHFEGDHGFFVFCDYLDLCWAYAICLTPHQAQARVVIVGTKDGVAQPVSNSFSEFAEMYARDDVGLYPAA